MEVPEKYTGSYFLLLYDCRLDFPGFVACTWSEVSLVVSQIVSYLVFKSYIVTSYICWPSMLSNISLEEAHKTPRQEFEFTADLQNAVSVSLVGHTRYEPQ